MALEALRAEARISKDGTPLAIWMRLSIMGFSRCWFEGTVLLVLVFAIVGGIDRYSFESNVVH